MSVVVNKKVTLDVEGLDGNAFMVIGAFSKQAKREGWSDEERKAVIDEAKDGDYDHLLSTIMKYCK